MLEHHRESLKRDDFYARFAYVTQEDLEYLNQKQINEPCSSSEEEEGDEEEMEMDIEEGIQEDGSENKEGDKLKDKEEKKSDKDEIQVKRDARKEKKCVPEESATSAMFAIRAPPDSRIDIPQPGEASD